MTDSAIRVQEISPIGKASFPVSEKNGNAVGDNIGDSVSVHIPNRDGADVPALLKTVEGEAMFTGNTVCGEKVPSPLPSITTTSFGVYGTLALKGTCQKNQIVLSVSIKIRDCDGSRTNLVWSGRVDVTKVPSPLPSARTNFRRERPAAPRNSAGGAPTTRSGLPSPLMSPTAM